MTQRRGQNGQEGKEAEEGKEGKGGKEGKARLGNAFLRGKQRKYAVGNTDR